MIAGRTPEEGKISIPSKQNGKKILILHRKRNADKIVISSVSAFVILLFEPSEASAAIDAFLVVANQRL